jgi:hypothetical protein
MERVGLGGGKRAEDGKGEEGVEDEVKVGFLSFFFFVFFLLVGRC